MRCLARLCRLDSSIRLKDAMKIYRACMLGVGTFSGLVKTELMNQGFDIFSDAVILKRFAEAQVRLSSRECTGGIPNFSHSFTQADRATICGSSICSFLPPPKYPRSVG
jgi:hypothetical protein